MFTTLFVHSAHRVARYFARRTTAKVITAFLFLFVLFALAFGIFLFFRSGFIFIESDVYAHRALLLYVYELFLLIVSGLVFVSALISGLLGLFRSGQELWFMVSPKLRAWPWYTAAQVFEASAWPFFLIALPTLFAVRDVFGLSWLGFSAGLAAVLLAVAGAVMGAMV
ncbi:MAG TPA: hypothetical protein VMC43_02665, partial [Candidatus Paceibacterota bacterium]|nr:hypothetical protein [Candidatus Paceibacterota bacterium]